MVILYKSTLSGLGVVILCNLTWRGTVGCGDLTQLNIEQLGCDDFTLLNIERLRCGNFMQLNIERLGCDGFNQLNI